MQLQDTDLPTGEALNFKQRSAIRQHIGVIGQERLEQQGYVLTSIDKIVVRVSTDKKGEMRLDIVGVAYIRG